MKFLITWMIEIFGNVPFGSLNLTNNLGKLHYFDIIWYNDNWRAAIKRAKHSWHPLKLVNPMNYTVTVQDIYSLTCEPKNYLNKNLNKNVWTAANEAKHEQILFPWSRGNIRTNVYNLGCCWLYKETGSLNKNSTVNTQL